MCIIFLFFFISVKVIKQPLTLQMVIDLMSDVRCWDMFLYVYLSCTLFVLLSRFSEYFQIYVLNLDLCTFEYLFYKLKITTVGTL